MSDWAKVGKKCWKNEAKASDFLPFWGHIGNKIFPLASYSNGVPETPEKFSTKTEVKNVPKMTNFDCFPNFAIIFCSLFPSRICSLINPEHINYWLESIEWTSRRTLVIKNCFTGDCLVDGIYFL